MPSSLGQVAPAPRAALQRPQLDARASRARHTLDVSGADCRLWFPGRGLFLRTGWSEGVELRLERGDSSELYVLLVSHLNQEGFHSRETPCDGLHDSGHDGLHASTTVSLLFRHSVHSTRGAARCPTSHTVSDIEQFRRAAWPLRERTGAGPAPLRARPTRVNRTSKRAGLEAAFP
jgi:hypothetical protein